MNARDGPARAGVGQAIKSRSSSGRAGVLVRIWVHIGMPKAASTSLQSLLPLALPHFARRPWTNADVLKTLHSPYDLHKELTKDWEALPNPHYDPMALRSDDLFILSNESYCYFPPPLIDGQQLSGLAVVRAPGSWVASGFSQTLLTDRRRIDEWLRELERSGSEVDFSTALRAFLEEKFIEYKRIIDAVELWSEQFDDFILVPYESKLNLLATLELALAKHGVSVRLDAPVPPRLRSASHEIGRAQLALAILVEARYRFGLDVTRSVELMELALAVDAGLLQSLQSSDESDPEALMLEQFPSAHLRYRDLFRTAMASQPGVLPEEPRLNWISPERAMQLAGTLIRARLRRAQLPPAFDSSSYLSMNPDVESASRESRDPLAAARQHYVEYGAFENRPAPTLL
jgi:hypothetical protein